MAGASQKHTNKISHSRIQGLVRMSGFGSYLHAKPHEITPQKHLKSNI